MKPILIIFSLFILNSQFSILNSTLWEIKQDGTGDFTTITAGINAAANGDTLLVYPGTYYENINYDGNNIVITSLYHVDSDDRRFIRETIIDGSNEDTVVRFVSGETRDAVLSGFTIRNGAFWARDTTFPAGGIHLLNQSAPVIQYCIIEHNFSYAGTGGIASDNANPLLRGNIVRYNHARTVGGISTRGYVNIEFCNIEPNSVYLNYGSRACDVFIFGIGQETIVIDTLSVLHPDHYFVNYVGRNIPNNFNIVVNHGKIEPIPADLYVSPDGCDTNSGLTTEEPLQRISTALTHIKPSTQVRRTIHLAPGVYSHTGNNQLFPIIMRDNIDIIGTDKESVILDGEDKYILILAIAYESFISELVRDFKIKNLTLTRAHGGEFTFGAIAFLNAKNSFLENILITRTRTAEGVRSHRLVNLEGCESIVLKKIDIIGNDIAHYGGDRLFTTYGPGEGETLYAENIRFHNNHSSDMGRIWIYPSRGKVTFVNLEITDTINNAYVHHNTTAHLIVSGRVRIINATITDNRYIDHYDCIRANGAIIVSNSLHPHRRNDLSIYNSILYDNHGNCQIILAKNLRDPYAVQDSLYVTHSLIEDGIDGIIDFYGGNHIGWGEGNIDADPLFIGENDFGLPPYSLSPLSPAIGAGTLDIPDFEFPEYDIAGNPRIVDGRIDMGAYQSKRARERRGDPSRERQAAEDFGLRNFPNPVTYLHSERQAGQMRSSTGTNISFTLPDNGKVTVEIYNLKGQFVKRLFDAYIPKGEHNIFWDGRDERGRYVATGFYMYNLLFNEQVVATGRATFIK